MLFVRYFSRAACQVKTQALKELTKIYLVVEDSCSWYRLQRKCYLLQLVQCTEGEPFFTADEFSEKSAAFLVTYI